MYLVDVGSSDPASLEGVVSFEVMGSLVAHTFMADMASSEVRTATVASSEARMARVVASLAVHTVPADSNFWRIDFGAPFSYLADLTTKC
jgi:guanyl-specific ribonuclease Sa